MLDTLKLFGLSLFVFLVIDLVWIVFVARKMYDAQIGSLLGQVKIVPVLIFYIIYIGGLVFFAVHPAMEKQSLGYAILAGAFLGAVGYGTFSLTNLSMLKDWTTILAVSDIAWGVVLSGATSGIVYSIAKALSW